MIIASVGRTDMSKVADALTFAQLDELREKVLALVEAVTPGWEPIERYGLLLTVVGDVGREALDAGTKPADLMRWFVKLVRSGGATPAGNREDGLRRMTTGGVH